MTRTRWLILLVALITAAGVQWWRQRDDSPAVSYRTAKIERGALQAVVSASGTVTPVSQVQVGSQLSGQIRELFADFNSEVKQGQLIARLDPETYEYRLRQASADVEASRASVLTAQANVLSALAQTGRAQVELDEARRDLDRKQGLVAQNFISPAEADTARARVATLAEALKATQAQVQVAQAQVRNAEAIVKQREAQHSQAKIDVERTQIRSPVDGIVIKRSVEVGQTVAASLQAPELFVIARSLSDMQVEAAIDEADISRVRIGQKVGFTIDAFPGRNFDGTVKQVRKAATSAQNVVTYIVVVAFANPGSTLLPGMTANVRVVTDTRDDVLKVPNAALRVRIAGIEPQRSSGATLGEWSVVPAAVAQPAGAASAPNGLLGEFRSRLLNELALSAVQLEKVDAVFAAHRARFAELRTAPEEERGRLRERIVADLRAQVGELLTPEQRVRYQALVAEVADRQTTRGRIYLLDAGRQPSAYNVRLGVSDGVATELIIAPGSADAGVLKDGATVITGVVGGSPGGAGAQRPGGAGPRPVF